MSKNVALFIDVANIYYAARGQDVDVDYVALLKHATKGRDLVRAYAYSGLDPENENQRKFLDFLSKNGYKVVHKDIRKFGDGRVKANLDIELVVDLFRIKDRMDIAVIVSGDGDFAPAMRALQDVGVRCEVISFRPNTSSDLIAVADEFTDIMKIIGIGRAKTSKHLPMPEMPAKEVNPEFGFREASRGVAAAALAALREGDKPARSPRRRSTRSSSGSDVAAEAAVADETAATLAAPAAEEHENGDGEGSRRRRRRRGGRGRGRGRRGGEQGVEQAAEEAVTPEGDEGTPIGWQEFDDISELTDLGDLGEERGYSFQEADAETLAALGLPAAQGPDDATAESEPARPARRSRSRKPAESREAAPAEEPAEAAGEGAATAAEAEPARPARRGRSRRATADAAEGKEPETETAPARPARRSRSRKTSDAGAPAETGATGATETEPAKPARRSRSRKAADGSAAPETAAGGDAEEGIWQRFRSARGGSRRTS